MCDYRYPTPKVTAADGIGNLATTQWTYCQRTSQFWIQSTISQHNMHACAHHLARIVRTVEEAARPFDIMAPIGTPEPDLRYALSGTLGVIKRMTPSNANGARVTVKPYTPKGR